MMNKIINNKYVNIFFCLLTIVIIDLFIYKYIFFSLVFQILMIGLIDLLIVLIFLLRGQFVYILFVVSIMFWGLLWGIKVASFRNSTKYGFIKYKNSPVLGNKKTGSYFDPFVLLDDGKYIMYFSERKNGNIMVASSSDGINWDNPQIALEKDAATGWEMDVNRASVIYKDGKYMMWYTGQNSIGSKIGYAQSDDGRHFSRTESQAILVPEFEYEQSNVMNPHVIYDPDDEKFKMWYAAGEQYEPDVICYAESNDGIVWEKYDENPIVVKSDEKTAYDSYKVGAADVHKLDDGRYLMFYIGYTDINTARIMYALSDDGINWNKAPSYMIQGTKFSFDHQAVYKPSAVYNNKWLLWYNGRLFNHEYIGLAYNNNYYFFDNLEVKNEK